MFNALCGFVIPSAIFTFFPSLGGHIAVGLRNAVNWIKEKFSASTAPKE